MWCAVILAAVVATASAQGGLRYDGTPIGDNVVVSPGQQQQQNQQVFVAEPPQVFVQPQQINVPATRPPPRQVFVSVPQPQPQPQPMVVQAPRPQQFFMPAPQPQPIVVQAPQPQVFMPAPQSQPIVVQAPQPRFQPQPQPQPIVVKAPQPQPQPDVFEIPEDVFLPEPLFKPESLNFFLPPPLTQPIVAAAATLPVQPPVVQVLPTQQFVPPVMQQQSVSFTSVPQVSSTCPSTSSQVHATYQRRLYHFSWCSQPGQVFSQSAARDFCRALGQVVVGNEEFDFDLYGVDRTTDYSFFLELLRQNQITSFWTRDRASTAPYVVRGSITRSESSLAGDDCLSLEVNGGLFLLENSCSGQKAAVCVAN